MNSFSIALLIILLVATAVFSWCYLAPTHNIVQAVLITFSVAFVALEIIKKIDNMFRLSFLKGYWIEDCGDVIKLHGSVRMADLDSAYNDIFKVRKGLIIVENAYDKYGCTLAAIQATPEQIKAKNQLEALGISVKTIG